MKREDEIMQEANTRYSVSHPFIDIAKESFIEGAKWADENPNLYNDEKYHTVKVSCLDELNRKAVLYDEFLEKACEYLESSLKQDLGYYGAADFANTFRKAMEE